MGHATSPVYPPGQNQYNHTPIPPQMQNPFDQWRQNHPHPQMPPQAPPAQPPTAPPANPGNQGRHQGWNHNYGPGEHQDWNRNPRFPGNGGQGE